MISITRQLSSKVANIKKCFLNKQLGPMHDPRETFRLFLHYWITTNECVTHRRLGRNTPRRLKVTMPHLRLQWQHHVHIILAEL